MRKKLVNSQLCNMSTYQMYLRQMTTLAENVFKFENLPEYIDVAYMNKMLVRKGSIAFFKDDVMGLLALPYTVVGKLDVYGRPRKIIAHGFQNAYRIELNNPDDFVIMYDNNGRYPLIIDIMQIAERISLTTRTTDINIRSAEDTAHFQNTTRKRKKCQRFSQQHRWIRKCCNYLQ